MINTQREGTGQMAAEQERHPSDHDRKQEILYDLENEILSKAGQYSLKEVELIPPNLAAP
jgi:hypothetical protein